MSLWTQGVGGRRPPHQPNPNGGGVKPLRAYRRHPYPPREERNDIHHELESYENLEQQDDYSGASNYETYEHLAPQPHLAHQPDVSSSTREDKRSALYQRLYEQFHGDGAKKPADCVVLSVNNPNLDYPKSLGHCLQERGLSVEMLYLRAESGLTRALQDVRSDGSPLCILVEQTNVTLSSCTVIIFSESLKIHRNMPKDQAMEFVMAAFERLRSGRRQRDPAEAAAQTTELTDDYLERAKLECHFVPSTTRHLLFLMAEGLHLYPEELSTIAEYIRKRQDHLQEPPSKTDSEVAPEMLNSFSAGLGKPPPLLSNPVGPSQPTSEHPNPPSGTGEPPQGHLMSAPASHLKTQPPPLLSVDVLQGSPHRPPVLHGTPASHIPGAPHGLPAPHGPAAPHGPRALHVSAAPYGAGALLDPPAPHGPNASHGPPDSYASQSTFSPQTPRGLPGPRGPLAPRGPPVLRSLRGPREPPVPCGPQPRQCPPGPSGPPATRGPADHGSHDFHPPRGPPVHHGPPLLHGPSSQNGPGGPRGPPLLRGPRAPPPALKSLHMGNPTGPRPLRRLLP